MYIVYNTFKIVDVNLVSFVEYSNNCKQDSYSFDYLKWDSGIVVM